MNVVNRALLAVSAMSAAVLSGSAFAEDWTAFHECRDANLNVVEQAEPSIHGGADLIVDVLCLEDVMDLLNELLISREKLVEQKDLGGATDALLYVMKRETKRALFEARKVRLGL